jgi:Cof subfamily protein (haloacid dehalogenase superfamily)
LRHSKIKLLVSDLDGTMLDSSGRIPNRNIEAVRAAMERGVKVTLCTGRMYSSARKFAETLGITDVPLICYNGSMIRGMDGVTALHLKLDMETARGLLALFRERGIYVQSYIDDELYIKDPDDDDFVNYTRHFGMLGRPVGDALYEPLTEPTKLLAKTAGIEASHALIRELSGRFGKKLYITSSNEDFVEMMNPEAGKGRCLAKLAEMLSIPMKNVMAMGDGENDAGMIRAAGAGAAMANGRESALAAADWTAPSNDECGAALAIEHFILNRP